MTPPLEEHTSEHGEGCAALFAWKLRLCFKQKNAAQPSVWLCWHEWCAGCQPAISASSCACFSSACLVLWYQHFCKWIHFYTEEVILSLLTNTFPQSSQISKSYKVLLCPTCEYPLTKRWAHSRSPVWLSWGSCFIPLGGEGFEQQGWKKRYWSGRDLVCFKRLASCSQNMTFPCSN